MELKKLVSGKQYTRLNSPGALRRDTIACRTATESKFPIVIFDVRIPFHTDLIEHDLLLVGVSEEVVADGLVVDSPVAEDDASSQAGAVKLQVEVGDGDKADTDFCV